MNPDGRLTDSEKLARVREYKERGNLAYKDGKFMKAAGCYHRAILFLKGLSINCPDLLGQLADGADVPCNLPPRMSPELREEALVLTCDCYSNLAACLLKEPEPKYQRIIEHCNKALEASPCNVKAIFRKGVAQYSLHSYEEALCTFQQAPPNPSILKYVELCKAGMKQQDRELAEQYKKMFLS